jgi:gluconokinase
MSSAQCPISAYTETKGLRYFPRMLCKIRLLAAGELREDFHEMIGQGLDGRLCSFLRIDYADLKEKTLTTPNDDEVFDWVQANGRGINETDILMWNHYVTKLGWRDQVTESLAKRKASSGLSDRDEIETMIEYFEYDEGRKS